MDEKMKRFVNAETFHSMANEDWHFPLVNALEFAEDKVISPEARKLIVDLLALLDRVDECKFEVEYTHAIPDELNKDEFISQLQIVLGQATVISFKGGNEIDVKMIVRGRKENVSDYAFRVVERNIEALRLSHLRHLQREEMVRELRSEYGIS